MSAIDIFKAVAAECALDVPSVAVGNTERAYVELIPLAQMAGEEIARRVNWSGLRKEKTIALDGVTSSFALDADFSRRMDGGSVKINGEPIRGGLSDDEWKALPAATGPARFFHLTNNAIAFWPTPPVGTAKFDYYSKHWCYDTVAASYGDKFTADSNTVVFPEIVLIKGTIARWRRLKALDYADHLAEFESVLADYAQFDGGPRSP